MGNGILDVSKLASPAVLSLLVRGGSNKAGLMVGGTLLAVTAAVFTYIECKAYEEKKHRRKIEDINQIYAEKLQQIVVPFLGPIDGFPPIFQLSKEGKYESLHYTLAQVKDIGALLPNSGDVALVSYRESIRAALRKLKEYYYLRAKNNNEEEVTIRVLSYLLHMIDTKCLHFIGYEYDIAYLGALTEFIAVYASLGWAEHSQHFSRLKEVYTNLLDAQKKLIKHKEALSLEETISALRDHCVQNSDLLIRTLVKMVAGKNETVLADTVNHDELVDGLLRQHYIHSEVWGFEIRHDPQVDIPDSIFKEWIKNLSLYYLRSLNIDETKENEQIPPYDNYSNFVERANLYLKNKKKWTLNPKTIKFNEEMEAQLKLIAGVFKNSDNFISSVYRLSDKKFHSVTDDKQIVERVKVLADFCKLIDGVISLQYLCIHLSKSIKQLGEIYVKNPLHFHKIFRAVSKLCVLIQTDLKTCFDDFTLLQEKNKNKMQKATKGLFPNEVKKLLATLSIGIEQFGAEVKSCRRKAKKAINQDTVQSVKYEMLVVAESVLERHFKSFDINQLPISSDYVGGIKNVGLSVLAKQTANPAINLLQKSKSLKSEDESIGQLKTLIKEIHKKINTISESPIEPLGAKKYFEIYDALIVMQEKAVSLSSEINKSEDRRYKANKTIELTLTLAQITANFLGYSALDRKKCSVSFAKEVHKILNNVDNSDVIDSHHNVLSRYIYTHLCNFGLFRTDTRQKFTNLDAACSKLSLG